MTNTGGRPAMRRAAVMLLASVVLWLAVGGVAAYERGDFGSGNCSTVTDTLGVVVVGPLNYAAAENLSGTCSRPTGPSTSPGQSRTERVSG